MIRRAVSAILPAGRVGRAMALLAVLIIAIWAVLFLRGLLTAGARTEARLGSEQGRAAIESGRDAIGTAASARQREDDLDRKTKEIQDEVTRAPDGVSADIAGRNGLCDTYHICDEDRLH